MRNGTIRTDIYLDGSLHGARRWPAVPRTGDLLWVYNAQRDEDRKTAAWCLVQQVRWIDDGDGELSHVDIYVTLAPSPS